MHQGLKRSTLLLALVIALGGCSTSVKDGGPSHYVDVSKIPDAVPKPLPKSRYGNPKSYTVYGKRYTVLPSAQGYSERGIASWYGTKFHGRLTSTREEYDMYAMTAASPILPLPSFVRVTNLENGRSVVVKVNDRGPFAENRILDLSYAAAKKLGYANKGTALVEVQAFDPQRPIYASAATKTPRTAIPNHPKLYLQLGAFSSIDHARALRERLKAYVKRPVFIMRTRSAHGPLYRVQVGPLAGVGESDRLQAELKSHGFGEGLTVII